MESLTARDTPSKRDTADRLRSAAPIRTSPLRGSSRGKSRLRLVQDLLMNCQWVVLLCVQQSMPRVCAEVEVIKLAISRYPYNVISVKWLIIKDQEIIWLDLGWTTSSKNGHVFSRLRITFLLRRSQWHLFYCFSYIFCKSLGEERILAQNISFGKELKRNCDLEHRSSKWNQVI